MEKFVSSFAEAIARKLTLSNVLPLSLLFASALISAGYLYLRANQASASLRGFLRFTFPRDILLHPSARADLIFWVTRKALMFVLLLPVSISAVATVGYATRSTLVLLLNADLVAPRPAGPITICVFTVSMLLVYDLSYYLYHRLQHQVPILWELHKVHHSAEV